MRRGLLVLALAGTLLGQETARPKQTVVYVAEAHDVPAGKQSVVELHFKVLDGYHVNSHTPKSEFLIPTTLEAKAAEGVKAGVPVYAPGREFSFAFSPEEKLDVYTGDFMVKLPVTSAWGAHTIAGSLRYQACDKAACYPPKTLAVEIPLTAK